MLLAITVFELSSGQTNRQTDKRDRKHYLSNFIGGGNKYLNNDFKYMLEVTYTQNCILQTTQIRYLQRCEYKPTNIPTDRQTDRLWSNSCA